MNFNSKMQAISDALRKQYGTTDKYKLADMPALIDGLEIKSYVPDESVEILSDNPIPINLNQLEFFNKMAGKNLTVSFDCTWENHTAVVGNNRIGVEFHVIYEDNNFDYFGRWVTPVNVNGSCHASANWSIPSKKVIAADEGYLYNQSDANVKITNFKLVVNPLGGGS